MFKFTKHDKKSLNNAAPMICKLIHPQNETFQSSCSFMFSVTIQTMEWLGALSLLPFYHHPIPQEGVVAVGVSHQWKCLLLYFGIMAGCPSLSPASRCSTGAAAVAAPNKICSSEWTRGSCAVQLCSPHLSKQWLLQRGCFPLWMSGFQLVQLATDGI